MNNLGIKQRRVGTITILKPDSVLRIALKFGMSAVSLERAVDLLMNSGQRQILLDLDGLKGISAKGLGVLVSIFARVTRSGGEFKLFNLTTPVRQLMTATSWQVSLAVTILSETRSQALRVRRLRKTPGPIFYPTLKATIEPNDYL